MADMIADGQEWLATQRASHMRQTVTYKRGDDSVQLSATVGSTEWEIEEAGGLTERIETRDYLIQAAALILDGSTVKPARGDLIQETVLGVTYTYKVLSIGTNPCWRFSDPYHKTLRIHTKLTGEA